MFRKPNRNLRVRKAASSEEEDEEKGENREPSQLERPRRPGGRGLTCGTKKRPEEEKPDTGDPTPERETTQTQTPGDTSGLLSFTEEREEEAAFKIKKPAVNAVVFQVQKKTENADSPIKPPENDSGDGSHSEPEDSEHENMDCNNKEESVEFTSSSTSQSASPEPSQTGEIPDAKQIRAARRRRKLARAGGDYISLDAAREASDSSNSESDDELDDHEKRIQFAPGMKTIKEQMAEEMSSSSSTSDSEEEDAEQDGWEEQQMRKAVKYPQIISENLLHGDSPPRVRRRVEPKLATPQVTLEDIRNRLTARMASIQGVHRSHVLDSEKYERDLQDSKKALEKLEKASSEQSYKFYKEMKTYVETFVDCLNEKIHQINEMEADLFRILEDRASTLLKRRQDDLRNESTAIQRLSGNGVTCGTEASDYTQQNQIQDCEQRRNKRRREREETRHKDYHEGMSSDDELPDDQIDTLQRSRGHILLQCKAIFEDVHEDYCQIKNILSKFHEWRVRFPESYYDAYISLCLHKILNPLVRLQLVGWNPLEDVADLEKMAWYHDLEEFCFPKDEHENEVEENADHKVLAAVIEKIVVPKVSGFVEHVWDPLSSKQTERLVCFCKTHVPENEASKMVKGLMVALVSRLKKAIEDDVYIPLYPQRLLEDPNSPHAKFRERQFWSAVKLLGNVVLWDGFLEEETLQELALDKLLNRYLLLVLLNSEPNGDMVTKCSKIVERLPQSWFKGLESGTTLARLANFSKHLQQCVHALHKSNDRNNMEALVSLLVTIKAQDYADEVISKYSLRSASPS